MSIGAYAHQRISSFQRIINTFDHSYGSSLKITINQLHNNARQPSILVKPFNFFETKTCTPTARYPCYDHNRSVLLRITITSSIQLRRYGGQAEGWAEIFTSPTTGHVPHPTLRRGLPCLARPYKSWRDPIYVSFFLSLNVVPFFKLKLFVK